MRPSTVTRVALTAPIVRLFSSSAASAAAAPFRPRRSFLYIPGSSAKMLAKPVASYGADTVCLDLEDGVAANQKSEARALISQHLQSQSAPASVERMVRINPMSTRQGVEDLEFVLAQPVLPDGICIPKLDTPAELTEAAEMIAAAEARVSAATGKFVPRLPIIGLIESPLSLMNLRDITTTRGSDRLAGVIFGGDDYGSAVGATRTASNHELAFARGWTLTVAKAAGIQAIDIVHKTFKDQDGLRAECQEAAEMGYTGKQLIHPLQVATTNELFAPSPALLRWAKKVVDAAAHHQSLGTGAFALDGVMIDMPTVKLAAGLYARGIACGVTPAAE